MAGAALGLAACLSGAASAATDPPPTVPVDAAVARPFAEVQASAFSFETDPSDPSRAIFRVTTTEPMICAIVWGDDDTFGRFNNSLSMNGTGITQHDVVLPDVEAGVTYQYVVEGTTADGTWYRSDVGTFSVEAVAVATTVDRGPEPRHRQRGSSTSRRSSPTTSPRPTRSTATPPPSGRPTATAIAARSPSTWVRPSTSAASPS